MHSTLFLVLTLLPASAVQPVASTQTRSNYALLEWPEATGDRNGLQARLGLLIHDRDERVGLCSFHLVWLDADAKWVVKNAERVYLTFYSVTGKQVGDTSQMVFFKDDFLFRNVKQGGYPIALTIPRGAVSVTASIGYITTSPLPLPQ